ncbi:MAG: 2Fe-2S iron-sulfur cluster-binding protein [Myxococcota bacterium]
MAELTAGDRRVQLTAGESVLDALTRAGVKLSSSCRAGACQSCLVQVTRGAIPERAQIGLKDSLRARNFVLACQATPTSDLEVCLDAVEHLEVPARIQDVTRLGEDVLCVGVRTARPLDHRAGQFVTLIREDGLARPYSIASRPEDGVGELLEFHVRIQPSGRMSQWLASEHALGANVRVRGPSGDCFYISGKPEQPLVLAGTGTGLAPLWGIACDALASGHRGPIELWHGARTPAGLYLRSDLERLARTHRNFSYHPCVLEVDPCVAHLPERSVSESLPCRVGKLDELLLNAMASFDAPRFYLCGDAQLVQRLKRALFIRGASLKEIYADPFVSAPEPATSN